MGIDKITDFAMNTGKDVLITQASNVNAYVLKNSTFDKLTAQALPALPRTTVDVFQKSPSKGAKLTNFLQTSAEEVQGYIRQFANKVFHKS